MLPSRCGTEFKIQGRKRGSVVRQSVQVGGARDAAEGGSRSAKASAGARYHSVVWYYPQTFVIVRLCQDLLVGDYWQSAS